jgi:hypothetical protein
MRARLERDFARFGRELPADFAGYVREGYRIDLSARYLGFPLPHPIGKGSGQLSLNLEQLEADRAAGLAFVVLKTVIAEEPAGERSMGAWAIHETRMKVERIRGASGREGWTVTWKGRGWDRSFDDYLALARAAGELTRAGGMLTVPSVKYHLPRLEEPLPGHSPLANLGHEMIHVGLRLFWRQSTEHELERGRNPFARRGSKFATLRRI